MIELLPNLGAEEGEDWQALRSQPAVRAAARLWALVFPRDTRLHGLTAEGESEPSRGIDRDALWPEALGPPTDGPACAGVSEAAGPVAWLKTPSVCEQARARFGAEPAGPDPEIVAALHDKAFAVEAGRTLGLVSRALDRLIDVIEPEALADLPGLKTRLDARLADWPEWTGRRFTLKPRQGSSGRGRLAGRDVVDPDGLERARPRFAARGGAIFEPWLSREADFSVVLDVPMDGDSGDTELPVLVGSLEMLASGSGVYRGHCGEVDNRGRVFAGDPDDEEIRADAAAVAGLARSRGHRGPCGVDAFRYREGGRDPEARRLRLRNVVEFNARPTMGLVAIGLIRRALPLVRDPLDLTPGQRRGFALLQLDARREERLDALRPLLPRDALCLDLTHRAGAANLRDAEPDPIQPTLVFTRDLAPLRAALREGLGC